MRLLLVTYGTEGDTRPVAAVAAGLAAAGHEVSLLADNATLAFAQTLGVPAAPLAGDIRRRIEGDPKFRRLMNSGGGATHLAAAVAAIACEHADEWLAQTALAAYGANAILFSGIASYTGLAVGEQLGIPAIGLGLWPNAPTRDFSSPLLRPLALGGTINRLSHLAINGLLWRMFRKRINEARECVFGASPRKAMWKEYPILFGFSEQLVPRPRDWPHWWRVSGAWSKHGRDWTPPAALQDFLSAGEPPIYVGFGSMAGFDADRVLKAVIAGVGRRRCLFYPGWSGAARAQLPDNFFVLGPTPHDWLFPRTSLVVHHGGAGTTHSAARAGVPSVVVPFAGDQHFWGHRLTLAGVAPDCVPASRIDGDALGALIAAAERRSMRANAWQLGQRMAHEDGISDAVKWIAHYAERR